MMRERAVLLGIFLLLLGVFSLGGDVRAQSVADRLRVEIDARNAQIALLEADISKYQAELDQIGKQKSTLESTIRSLDLSRQKLSTDIKITQNKIGAANLKLQELELQIGNKEQSITVERATIARALRNLNERGDASVIEQVFASEDLSDAWTATDDLESLNRALALNIAELAATRATLSENHDQVTTTKKQLSGFATDLTNQRRAVDLNRTAQQTLLSQTKNQESTYQKLLADKKAARAAFEQELSRLQSELQITIDPSKIPRVGSGVLAWPFPNSFMKTCVARKSVFDNLFCITQYFGNTPFATQNPQVYNNKGHNGIDFGAPVGTPINAALSGTIAGVGNTDLVRGCYSYGKWVLVTHANGLSTLYAHLSDIRVREGQVVITGELLGYSGETGYATGPHLHFTVLATQGVRVTRFTTSVNCKNATVPIAPSDAYLNPMSYL